MQNPTVVLPLGCSGGSVFQQLCIDAEARQDSDENAPKTSRWTEHWANVAPIWRIFDGHSFSFFFSKIGTTFLWYDSRVLIDNPPKKQTCLESTRFRFKDIIDLPWYEDHFFWLLTSHQNILVPFTIFNSVTHLSISAIIYNLTLQFCIRFSGNESY